MRRDRTDSGTTACGPDQPPLVRPAASRHPLIVGVDPGAGGAPGAARLGVRVLSACLRLLGTPASGGHQADPTEHGAGAQGEEGTVGRPVSGRDCEARTLGAGGLELRTVTGTVVGASLEGGASDDGGASLDGGASVVAGSHSAGRSSSSLPMFW